MWVIAVYHQVSLFSLKPSDTTSTGGKSLLVPSPYSIKMAVLDAAIRAYGVRIGSEVFTLLRDSAIALSPPRYIIVNNCFVRIQKRRRPKSRKESASGKRTEEDQEGTTPLLEDEEGEGEEETADEGLGPYDRSVSFREYVQYGGPLGLALQVSESDGAVRLSQLLPLINYLGKRGGFFQLDSLPFVRELLPHQQGYLRLDGSVAGSTITSGSILQVLDDWHPSMTFDQVNVYSPALAVGKDRLQRQVQLPYRLLRSSHGFTLYQRTDIE